MSDLILVSPSEQRHQDQAAKLQAYGLNAVVAEGGTDYVWFPHGMKFGIERKTISNLLSSLKDRQLVEQAQKGSTSFDRYMLLLEGEYGRVPNGKLKYFNPGQPGAQNGWVESGWLYDAVDSMLTEMQIGLGVVLLHEPVMFESARKIASVVQTTSNGDHKFLKERQRPDLGVRALLGGKLYTDAVWALSALPGVGSEVAEAMLAQYGSLAKAIEQAADPVALSEVKINGKRLGVKRAERIAEAVNTVYA